MKRCENCFEPNSDGATNCVICGDPLEVPQVIERTSSVSTPRFEAAAMSDVVEIDEDVILEEYEDDETVRRNSVVPVAEVEVEEVEETEAPATVDGPAPQDDEPAPQDDDEPAPQDDEPEPVLVPVDEPDPQPVVPEPTPPPPPVVPVASPPPPPALQSGGAVVLQVFHDSEPRVVHVHPVVNDITLVGREDPQRDAFPDLDLGRLPREQVSSGRASRQHLRLLREGDRFYLYVYKGTTGTQVCDRMVDPSSYGKRFEIQVGDRIILGGKVRMKLARVDG